MVLVIFGGFGDFGDFGDFFVVLGLYVKHGTLNGMECGMEWSVELIRNPIILLP